MKRLSDHISELLGEQVVVRQTLSGGSISAARLLESRRNQYFLKVNSEPFALDMFQVEAEGLKLIEQSDTIAVPHVHLVGAYENQSFLLMDYVESKRPVAVDSRALGSRLAAMHQIKADSFGLDFDNYIGKLPQSNNKTSDWSHFYWQERILPQLEMAHAKGLLRKEEIPTVERAIAVFDQLLDDVSSSLLHGDLWGGNYLIASSGKPYLIDPAVYYGDPMVDIAMSKLFGGFSPDFYESYHDVITRSSNYQERIDLYQLYFLLVHLNLFGSGYYSGVSRLLRKYF